MHNTPAYDVIIVGGGMTGLALACMLAQKTSLSIVILESQSHSHPWSASRYSHRVSAITLSSKRIFESLGVWDSIRNKRVGPFAQIDVWDAVLHSEIVFESKEIAEPFLGYIIENTVIQSTLEEKIRQYSQVELISSVKLTRFIEHEHAIELVADDKRVFMAKLVVAADGANSWLRSQAQIDLERFDYAEEAIVATVHTALPHQAVARQVFLETGPLAFLPLADTYVSSIVWSLPVKEAARLMALDEDHFQHVLARAFQHRLGDIVRIEQRYAFPLYKQIAASYVKSHVVLVGDAAHSVHPLAGQGVNMGLLDAASFTDIMVEAIENHRDITNVMCLRRYERWRKADNFAMLTGIDAIKNVFASNKKSIKTMRFMGLTATNRMTWIKNIFTRHAVGDRAGLPSMARG